MVRKATERRYSARQDATPPPAPTAGFTDDHIINPDLDISAKIIRPRWHTPRGGVPRPRNVFRILPVLDPDTGELSPFRYSDEPGDYGDWLYGTYIADNVGVRNVCYLMGDNRFVDEISLPETPLAKLHANVTKAISVGEGKPEWNSADAKLVQIGRREFNPGSKERPPLLTRPKFVYMLQVAVVSHEEKPENIDWWGINDADPTMLLIMSANAGMNLIAQLDAAADLDPVSLDAGLFIDVHSVDSPPPGCEYTKASNEFGYTVTLRQDFNGMTPSLAHRVADVQKHVRWWDDIIYIPTDEEQVQLICSSDLPASAIMYGLGDDFSAYIPDSIRNAGQRVKNMTSAMSAKPNIPKSNPESETQPIATAPGNPTKGESVAESLRRIREAKQKQSGN
jgi:hypothetical protein